MHVGERDEHVIRFFYGLLVIAVNEYRQKHTRAE